MAPARSFLAGEERGEGAAEADAILDWPFLGDLTPQGEEGGTELRRKPLEMLDSSRNGAGPLLNPSRQGYDICTS